MTTEKLHPDGLPISATPWIDRLHDDYCGGGISDVFSALIPLERMKRKAEADAADQRAWKETAYTERAKLVSLITRLFHSYLSDHEDKQGEKPWDAEWRKIVFVRLPTGQASWHMHDRDVPLFAHLSHGVNRWDGHTTQEKYERVLAVRPEMLDRDRIDLARQLRDATERAEKAEAIIGDVLAESPDPSAYTPAWQDLLLRCREHLAGVDKA